MRRREIQEGRGVEEGEQGEALTTDGSSGTVLLLRYCKDPVDSILTRDMLTPRPAKASPKRNTCFSAIVSRGNPICLVHVLITAPTGLPLDISRASHRSSVMVCVCVCVCVCA